MWLALCLFTSGNTMVSSWQVDGSDEALKYCKQPYRKPCSHQTLALPTPTPGSFLNNSRVFAPRVSGRGLPLLSWTTSPALMENCSSTVKSVCTYFPCSQFSYLELTRSHSLSSGTSIGQTLVHKSEISTFSRIKSICIYSQDDFQLSVRGFLDVQQNNSCHVPLPTE